MADQKNWKNAFWHSCWKVLPQIFFFKIWTNDQTIFFFLKGFLVELGAFQLLLILINSISVILMPSPRWKRQCINLSNFMLAEQSRRMGKMLFGGTCWKVLSQTSKIWSNRIFLFFIFRRGSCLSHGLFSIQLYWPILSLVF